MLTRPGYGRPCLKSSSNILCSHKTLIRPLLSNYKDCCSGGRLFVVSLTVVTLQVNLLSVVLNDAPILPEADEDVTSLLKDSPQCMAFGLFMIW